MPNGMVPGWGGDPSDPAGGTATPDPVAPPPGSPPVTTAPAGSRTATVPGAPDFQARAEVLAYGARPPEVLTFRRSAFDREETPPAQPAHLQALSDEIALRDAFRDDLEHSV